MSGATLNNPPIGGNTAATIANTNNTPQPHQLLAGGSAVLSLSNEELAIIQRMRQASAASSANNPPVQAAKHQPHATGNTFGLSQQGFGANNDLRHPLPPPLAQQGTAAGGNNPQSPQPLGPSNHNQHAPKDNDIPQGLDGLYQDDQGGYHGPGDHAGPDPTTRPQAAAAAHPRRSWTVYDPNHPGPDTAADADGVVLGVVPDEGGRRWRERRMRLARYVQFVRDGDEVPVVEDGEDGDVPRPLARFLDLEFRRDAASSSAPVLKGGEGRGGMGSYVASRPGPEGVDLRKRRERLEGSRDGLDGMEDHDVGENLRAQLESLRGRGLTGVPGEFWFSSFLASCYASPRARSQLTRSR